MSYACAILATANLLAFWPFDETSGRVAADVRGVADLTVAGGVTLGAAPLVHGGKAAATFARSASGRASRRTSYGAAGVSFEGWFRCDDLATQRQAIFFNGSGNNGFGLVLNGPSVTGKLSVLFQNIDWLNTNYSPGTEPHHFVLTLAGSNPVTLTLYVDGVQVWAHARTPPNPPSGGFTIGAESTAGGGGFTGAIDDFAVHDAVLDPATALAHYDAGKAPAPVGEARWAIRRAAWESRLHASHSTGSNPYLAGPRDVAAGVVGYAPGADDHYDPIAGFIKLRDYTTRRKLPPTDWSVQVAAAITRYRDRYVGDAIALGGGVPGYYVYTHGLAIHYHETGDAADLKAIAAIVPATGDLPTVDAFYNIWWRNGAREVAYVLQGSIDRRWCGMPPSPFEDVSVRLCLDFIEHWTRTPAQRYGVYNFPWIDGLVARSLVAYWEYHRHTTDPTRAAFVAAIPGALESLANVIWDRGWWPQGVAAAAEGGSTWPEGSIKYAIPDAARPEYAFAPIGGLKIQAVITNTAPPQFTGPASLSTVDDFYKGMSIAVDPPAAPGTELSVRAYSGATRKFTVGRLWGSHYNFAAGRGFSLVPNGYSTDPNEKKYSYASPALNPLVAPLFAFVYWHRKVVLGDAVGAAVHRSRHDAVFTGQKSAWMGLGSQKERNQSVLWSTDGLAYRAYGDAGTGYTSVYGTVIKAGGPPPSPNRRPSPSPAS